MRNWQATLIDRRWYSPHLMTVYQKNQKVDYHELSPFTRHHIVPQPRTSGWDSGRGFVLRMSQRPSTTKVVVGLWDVPAPRILAWIQSHLCRGLSWAPPKQYDGLFWFSCEESGLQGFVYVRCMSGNTCIHSARRYLAHSWWVTMSRWKQAWR